MSGDTRYTGSVITVLSSYTSNWGDRVTGEMLSTVSPYSSIWGPRLAGQILYMTSQTLDMQKGLRIEGAVAVVSSSKDDGWWHEAHLHGILKTVVSPYLGYSEPRIGAVTATLSTDYDSKWGVRSEGMVVTLMSGGLAGSEIGQWGDRMASIVASSVSDYDSKFGVRYSGAVVSILSPYGGRKPSQINVNL